MMPVSTLMTPASALAAGTLTPQQLADFALEADRLRRRALVLAAQRPAERDEYIHRALECLRERNALLELAWPQSRAA